MIEVSRPIEYALTRYPNVVDVLNRVVTGDAFFDIFKQLSDNYSPSLTVSRVQGPLIEQIVARGAGQPDRIRIDRNLRRSGTIGIAVGNGRPALWLSAHADICSYLTGPWDGSGYPLTPFCSHRAGPGRRAAMALGAPRGDGPLDRLAEGEMVTLETGDVRFACDRDHLPLQTRVVHHLPATWDRATDRVLGFLDNEAGSATLLLAAQALSYFDANVLMLLNDEEEGPVDTGNQTFSRAATRLLHRTPLDEHPNYVVVTDGHDQEALVHAGAETYFGKGATFAGLSSRARGAVTPPHILAFTRELAEDLQHYDIRLLENPNYVGRSDDVSAMQWTQNVSIIGYPGVYSHFDQTPYSHVSDLVNLTKTLVLLALIAQDTAWQQRYL